MSGETILIIDDSQEIVKHLTEYVLPTFGYNTLHAFDGKTGLNLIQEKQPDLVMLDLHLPVMTGTDVLQHMAKDSLSTPVVLMTGYGSEQSAIDAFRLGAKDYIIKPFTVDEIIETIDRALVEPRLLHDKEELAEQLRRSKVESSRQSHDMETLANIGKAITSLLSVDKVLERVLKAAKELTGAEESRIWMPDDSGDYLRAYGGKSPGRDDDEISQLELSIATSQVGQVLKTGRPLRKSHSTGKGIKVQTGFMARSVLFVPLKLRGVSLGVLGVSNRVAFRAFSSEDEFLISFLADYAAIALENARVFQAADQALTARLEELNTLSEISRTITSSLELDEVVNQTIKQVHHAWNIEASSLWWIDDTREFLKVLANVGTPSDVLTHMRLSIKDGIVGEVARTGKWIYTNDVSTHPLHFKQADYLTGFDTRSILCVPLVFQRKVVGAMELLNKMDGDFDDQDVEKAFSIAFAVAIAVSHALLFEEAKAREKHLEVTLEHSYSPILITDAVGNVHLLNQEARQRFNLSSAVIGQPVSKVMQLPDLISLLMEPIAEPAENFEENFIMLDGAVWLPRVAPIPGYGRILILQDITHLREWDETKNHFVATISQDMRDPLNDINQFTDSLATAGSLNDEQMSLTEQLQAASAQMMGLVDGLLELAKVNTGMEPVTQSCDVMEIVTEVVQDYQSRALAKKIVLVMTAEPGIRAIQGNPAQLRRAISNLVDNAIKFSPEGETVDVFVFSSDQAITIKVSDKGSGIAEGDIPHIFDTFYRGQDGQGRSGPGLGLALVHSIAVAHGGKIWVESENGDGSNFLLQLPVNQSST